MNAIPPPKNAFALATEAQRAASDPHVSSFVAASAGSGKTKLLTDRLLRLMLAEADPARIVCLTYTRAGAAEMALRLRGRLGKWVAMNDGELRRELGEIDVEASPDMLIRARSLFATVLDLPGGLRIGTIHAFCQSLLARFPLEAGLSPRFALLEEADGRLAQSDALEWVLARDPPGLREAIGHVSAHRKLGELRLLMDDLLADRECLAGILDAPLPVLRARQRAVLGAEDRDAVMARAVKVPQAAAESARAISEKALPTAAALAQTRCDWLALPTDLRVERWADYAGSYLIQEGTPRKKLTNKEFKERHPDHADAATAEAERVYQLTDALAAAELLDLSNGLLQLALPAIATFTRRKELTARLDYADLIERTVALLRDSSQAAWVLHKLDGGIDHLLLDEVQDTAPAQWKIAEALTQDFFAGEGARDELPVPRSVFAVGDRKQSIFSFQGADPDGFDREHDAYRSRVADAGAPWAEVALNVSFRSTAPVLALVDAVFADETAREGVGPVNHVSSRPGQAGSVELMDIVPKPVADKPDPYHVPPQRMAAKSATQTLVDKLAGWIRDETDGSVMLESHGRPLRPGDVLVLVRNRDETPRALIRALKKHGVPVAGLDQMRLTEQPAVADLLALCDALLLPSDDLAVGCVLTSPLGDLPDDDLMALAMKREPGVTLWEALRARAGEQPAWQRAWTMLAALFARVDHVTPYALLTEALGVHGGQARLLRRLGAEAADPIAELLAASLTHGASHPPSLQGFVHWLRRSAAMVKREAHGAGDLVRVMTVHGAKGLQAPLVILPDTTFVSKAGSRLLWTSDADGVSVPLWSPAKHTTCSAFEALHAAHGIREAEENRRLLYVALTRAEDRLVVWGKQGKTMPPPPGSWYAMIAAGMERLGDAARCPQTAAPDRTGLHRDVEMPQPLPAWAGSAPDWAASPPPVEPPLAARLAPSRPEGADLGEIPASLSPLAARPPDARFARGRLIHRLLQHLPDLPPPEREAAAMRLLSRPAMQLDSSARAGLWLEIAGVLDHPALAPAFGPGSRAEVPLSGVLGGVVIGGLVDRLAVGPDAVLIVDYKTNRSPPADAAGTPIMYLRQMAAYRALLQAIYSDRTVDCALVWTATATVADLPPDLLDAHAPQA